MNRNRIIALMCCIVFGLTVSSAQVVVIANKSLSVASISKESLRDLYTLDSKNLGSTKVILFDIREDCASKSTFYRTIGITPDAAKKIWLRAKLTGAGDPPSAVSEEEIVQKVANTPGSIGYVSASKVQSGVKVILQAE